MELGRFVREHVSSKMAKSFQTSLLWNDPAFDFMARMFTIQESRVGMWTDLSSDPPQ